VLYKPIIDAVETQIKEDDVANQLIALYNRFTVSPGVHSVPVCVIATSLGLKLSEEFLGQDPNNRPRLWDMVLGISILTRNYPLQTQVIRARESVDAAQHAVYNALNKDCTFGDVVNQSWVDSVREITLLNAEYRGFEIMLQMHVFESST
jgi:hypothetical protein